MQLSLRKIISQPDVIITDFASVVVMTEHEHKWKTIAFGYEMCVGCGAIRKAPRDYRGHA